MVYPRSAFIIHRSRGFRYLALALAANGVLWGIATLLLQTMPRTYTSHWSVMVIGGSMQSAPRLPVLTAAPNRIGSAIQQNKDVKESYKVIAVTDAVRKAAAARLGITIRQFGSFSVQAAEGTNLINFAITGLTAEEAQRKAYALHDAFQERLSQLRSQQITEQDDEFDSSLRVARKRLETAQLRLSNYKVRSGLTSKQQIDQLTSSIETLRRLKADVTAQQQEVDTRSRQLAADLSLSPQLAMELNPLAIAHLGLGMGTPEGDARELLFNQITINQMEQQRLVARALDLDRQITQLEEQLSGLLQRRSTMDDLNQDVQIAEKILSSTLSHLDASKANIFGVYPPIQMVAEPNLPGDATIAKRNAWLLGAEIASVLLTAGLLILCFRKPGVGKNLLLMRHPPHTT
jgi:uncharacterized protein involved in exopolysaccharide biosynthesis